MDSKASKGPCLCESGSTHAGKTAVCERRCCSDGGHARAQRQRSARGNAAGRIDQKSPSRTETLKSSEGGREADGCTFAAAGGARGSPSVAHARGEAACTTARTSVRPARACLGLAGLSARMLVLHRRTPRGKRAARSLLQKEGRTTQSSPVKAAPTRNTAAGLELYAQRLYRSSPRAIH